MINVNVSVYIEKDSLEIKYLGHFEENILLKKIKSQICRNMLLSRSVQFESVIRYSASLESKNFRHFEGGDYVYEINIVEFGKIWLFPTIRSL